MSREQLWVEFHIQRESMGRQEGRKEKEGRESEVTVAAAAIFK